MTHSSHRGPTARLQRGLTGIMALSAAARGADAGLGAPQTGALGIGAGADTFTLSGTAQRTLQGARAAALPACTPARCFNASRCETSQKVYVYPQPAPRLDRDDHGSPYYGYLPRAPDTGGGLYTDNPDAACLMAVYMWSVAHDYAELPTLPHWNGGQNHILIDFTDPPFMPGAPGDVVGAAMVAKSYASRHVLRPGFDLSVPLLKLSRTEANVQAVAKSGLFEADARKYFLTFKGSTYREGTAGSYRWALENIGARDADVVIRLQCFKLHGWHLQDAFRDRCNAMDARYADADYFDLANTTFALVPGGRQPASYRLTEALGAASIPVFVNPDVDWVKPYAHAIDWDGISLTFRPGQEARILPTLREMAPEAVARMRDGVRRVYAEHFGTPAEMGAHLYGNALAQMAHRQSHHRVADG